MRSSGSSYACRSGDNTAKYLIRIEIFRGSSYACPMVSCPQPALRVINSAREFLCVPRPPPRDFICVPESTLREFVCVVLRRPGGSSYACSWPPFREFLCAATPQGRRSKAGLRGSSYACSRRRARGVPMRAPAARSAAWREFVCVIRRGLAGSLSRASASRSLPKAAAPSLCRRLRSSPVGKPRVPLEEL